MTGTIMSKTILLILLLVTLSLPGPARAEGGFLAECEDLPLPPGLQERSGGMLFDSPTGRIVDAQAEGPLSAQQVRAFYAETLPQLGWEQIGDASYRRDREVLRMTISGTKPPVSVRFSVVPQ